MTYRVSICHMSAMSFTTRCRKASKVIIRRREERDEMGTLLGASCITVCPDTKYLLSWMLIDAEREDAKRQRSLIALEADTAVTKQKLLRENAAKSGKTSAWTEKDDEESKMAKARCGNSFKLVCSPHNRASHHSSRPA